MTTVSYVQLQYMEVTLHQTVLELIKVASECAREHQLPTSLAWLLEGTASLIERGGSASDCVRALRSMELLLPQLQQACSDRALPLAESICVKNIAKRAETRLRDLMVIKVQLTVPFKRDAFEEAVDKAVNVAHGRQDDPVERDIRMHSQIMQSYRKVIWNRNVGAAFPSNCEVEKEKTGRKRQKRVRKE